MLISSLINRLLPGPVITDGALVFNQLPLTEMICRRCAKPKRIRPDARNDRKRRLMPVRRWLEMMMADIRFESGQILFDGGAIAMDAACCCGADCETIGISAVTATFANIVACTDCRDSVGNDRKVTSVAGANAAFNVPWTATSSGRCIFQVFEVGSASYTMYEDNGPTECIEEVCSGAWELAVNSISITDDVNAYVRLVNLIVNGTPGSETCINSEQGNVVFRYNEASGTLSNGDTINSENTSCSGNEVGEDGTCVVTW